jgi:hypothetical protein
MMNIRHKIGKWLWKENEWTKAVDSVEAAAKLLQTGQRKVVWRFWRFSYMKPPVVLKVRMELANTDEELRKAL